jgi:hypothetical protein
MKRPAPLFVQDHGAFLPAVVIEYHSVMRRVLIALGVCLAIATAVGQACAQSAAPESASSSYGAPPDASGSSASPDYASSAPNAGGAGALIDTRGYTKDQTTSQALTDYLTQHKLPLVGAQVLNGPSGGRAVVLYGFTGTDFGKGDAVTKARKYLNDPTVVVENRIKVNPGLLTANKSGANTDAGSGGAAVADNSPDPADNMPGANSYVQHQNDLQQYAQSQANGPSANGPPGNGSSMSALSPLVIMALGMGLAIVSNGAISIGSGSSGPPGFGSPGFGPPGSFGGAPYNPYPGYPSGTPNSNPNGP